jgi:ABC-type ATPase with predicted acetyltransferase domain
MKRRIKSTKGRIRVLETARRPCDTLLRACATFGMGVKKATRKRPSSRGEWKRCAREVLVAVRSPAIVLVTGPSGAGKSTVLRELHRMRRARTTADALDVLTRPGLSRTMLDELTGTLEERLELLGRVGLGDATLLARSFHELSEGQRHRFMIAWMLERARCERARLVIADEFTSTLDRVTAMAVAKSLRKWFDRARLKAILVVATAHADVERWLRPDVTVRIGLDGRWRISKLAGE